MAAMLRPVAVALDKAQSDNTGLAGLCDIFFKLLSEPVLQEHHAAVQKRFDFAIKPCHLVAYMFHPKYMDEHLSLEQVDLKQQRSG